MIDPEEWMTVPEAAKQLGISTSQIWGMINDGLLKSQRFVSVGQIEHLLEQKEERSEQDQSRSAVRSRKQALRKAKGKPQLNYFDYENE